METRTYIVAILAGILASLCGPAAARAAAPAACTPDAQKLCASAPAGGGRVLECLEEHADQISAECRTALAAARRHAPARHDQQPAPAWVRPCETDINKLCKDAPRSIAGIDGCLQQHRSGLSSGCKAAIDNAAK